MALITQDGAQQVSLSPEDLQALGSAISMVTQHGSTTLAIPSHDDTLATSGAHTVAMVSADGTQTQPVTIITSGTVVAEDSSVASLHHQQVALLATANGTHIAVQLEAQQTLEEAISVATAAMQRGQRPWRLQSRRAAAEPEGCVPHHVGGCARLHRHPCLQGPRLWLTCRWPQKSLGQEGSRKMA